MRKPKDRFTAAVIDHNECEYHHGIIDDCGHRHLSYEAAIPCVNKLLKYNHHSKCAIIDPETDREVRE